MVTDRTAQPPRANMAIPNSRRSHRLFIRFLRSGAVDASARAFHSGCLVQAGSCLPKADRQDRTLTDDALFMLWSIPPGIKKQRLTHYTRSGVDG
jgi:hypothetical protein